MAISIKKIKPEFVDNRGYISRILDQKKIKIRSILIIESKKGSVRGDHYHKKDAHFVYCLSGNFKYSEKNIQDNKSRVESTTLKPGDLILSKAMHWHKMEFLENSIFLAFSTETRGQNRYESDTVRGNQ